MTNKGTKTKNKILYYAKQEFYEKGYDKALIETIAKNSNVRLGNITYYFNKKEDMIKELYIEFWNKIDHFIDTNFDCNIFQRICYSTIIYIDIILSDENNKRLFSEMLLKKSNYEIQYLNVKKLYDNIIDFFDLKFSDTDFEVFILFDFGSRREILLSYFSGQLNISFNELIYYIISIVCKNLGIPSEVLELNLNNCFNNISKYDYSELKFLV